MPFCVFCVCVVVVVVLFRKMFRYDSNCTWCMCVCIFVFVVFHNRLSLVTGPEPDGEFCCIVCVTYVILYYYVYVIL